MVYFSSSNLTPLHYISCGQHRSDEFFLHQSRNLDTFVLLVICDGTLYIAQDSNFYELKENQFVLLFPGHHHYGYLASDPGLTYYWCHFQLNGEPFRLLREEEINQLYFRLTGEAAAQAVRDSYLIPEAGCVFLSDRTSLLFRQLIDLSRQNFYSPSLLDYTLSLLMMEITQEFLFEKKRLFQQEKTHYNIVEIMEWIRIHYSDHLTVKTVADHFRYNPNYLSMIFKRYTGYPLLQYINKVRISVAKQLLLNSADSIKEISAKIGFEDDKYFMKFFKQHENMTPTQYRNIYYRKHFTR